jgi:hypothetical protein
MRARYCSCNSVSRRSTAGASVNSHVDAVMAALTLAGIVLFRFVVGVLIVHVGMRLLENHSPGALLVLLWFAGREAVKSGARKARTDADR